MSVPKFFPRWLSGLAVVFALASAGPLLAQQTGQITGHVIGGTGQPLGDVQISVTGTGLGALTNGDGRYLILNVPVGQIEIRAQLIGYGEERATVTVSAGEPVVQDFQLQVRAVQLEGMVVTGTAVESQARAVGSSISLITAEEIEALPVTSVSDILRGRALGVTVSGQPSAPGADARVLLRGYGSVEGRNDPLIYIDGMRVHSSGGYEESHEQRSNETMSVLSSIDPRDIERVEIIKGAAASTLYGTEGSAGVIQIFTKRGRAGRPRWTLNVDQGLSFVGHVGPKGDKRGLNLNDCTGEPGCPESGSWLRTGWVQDYDLSVRGGTEDVTYYLSVGSNNTQGIMNADQSAKMRNFRGNFTFNGFEDFQVRVNSSYVRRDVAWVPNQDGDQGLFWNVVRGDQGETPDNDDSAILEQDLDQFINQFNIGTQIDWTPSSGFRHRLNTGMDYSSSHYIYYRPVGYWSVPDGDRGTDIENRLTLSTDYRVMYGSGIPFLSEDFTSNLAAGAQYTMREHLGLRADVRDFAGPGEKRLQNATERWNSNEEEDRDEIFGFFLQEEIGWKNRAFLTVGFRADSHSSFGEDLEVDYGLLTYPKVQATYTISDHDFWPMWFETFRLRGAVGESGDPPRPGYSLMYFRTDEGTENYLGFEIDNAGNNEIGPERTREWEAGFDASMFGGRLNVTTTAYWRKTYDGFVSANPPYSNGISESIIWNIGEWFGEGVETAIDFNAVDIPNVRANIRAQYQYNWTRMGTLHNDEDVIYNYGYNNYFWPGRPMPSYRDQKILNPDSVGQLPIYTDTLVHRGPTFSPHQGSLGFNFTFFNRLTLDAFFVGEAGAIMSPELVRDMTNWEQWQPCFEELELIKAGDISTLRAETIARCSPDYTGRENWASRNDYLNMQSLTLGLQVPTSWIESLPISSALVQVQARNLFTITHFPGGQPRSLMNTLTEMDRVAGWVVPAPTTVNFNLRLNF